MGGAFLGVQGRKWFAAWAVYGAYGGLLGGAELSWIGLNRA
ncbi:hypothetical protein [Nocardia cyriacigeorgica]|nr:hypothetical protein [Nocardia cyriacigeorgica]